MIRRAVDTASLVALRRLLIAALRIVEDALALDAERRVTKAERREAA